mmetsp:Transcript_47589/g.113253  ORF Transcript_47589/g.113253 Transcript_47589/m.113253 type:complete len:217 (-) Transcript_47589:294-944(-)
MADSEKSVVRIPAGACERVKPVVRSLTSQLAEEEEMKEARIVLGLLCCFSGCSLWIPALFWMGASNILPSCERYESFKDWMRVFPLLPAACGLVVQVFSAAVAFLGQRSLYKVGLRLQILTGLGTLLLVAWGWVEYTQTSDAACVGGGRVHPKMLSLLFLVLSSIYCPCVLLLTVWRVCCVDINARVRKEGHRRRRTHGAHGVGLSSGLSSGEVAV